MINKNSSNEKLIRRKVGGLPLICDIIDRMGLRQVLYDAIGTHGNESFPAVESLILLIINLTLGKQPLYELQQWVHSLDPRSLGYQSLAKGKFNDDRFGRALDKLYKADRATLMTRFVINVVKAFDLKLDRIHNDSTSIKACGKYPGKTETGFELKHGYSKDHRPDLKQLIYSLSICSDGAVPVHQKTYPGNRNDDTTHIETWETLCQIHADRNFLYVGDSKLCTTEQLSYIVSQGGRAVTIIPEYHTEVRSFKDSLRRRGKSKHEIWRRPRPNNSEEMEYYSTFKGNYVTKQLGYRIHWIHSSEKRKRDQASRLRRLREAEEALMELSGKINVRRLKTKQAIQRKIDAILERLQVAPFLHIDIGTAREVRVLKTTRGRPNPDPMYDRVYTKVFTLGWSRNQTRLRQETQVDGLFPLLCTDHSLSTKEVLQAYKYQPRLEKRFNQLKQIHRAAPLLFKKLERVEATMFAFFIALTIQALIERQVRQQMADRKIPALTLYPEDRDASHPTTAKIMGIFSDISTYTLVTSETQTKEFRDDLSEVQHTILELLSIPEANYWQRKQTP